MNYRSFGRTGWQVSEISFGAWALGADWGHVSEEDALDALYAALDEGINFIDTADDHRNYNRHGEAFDVGETFSGVDYESGLEAVERLRPLVPENVTMAQFALRWILMFDAVSCAIPGAKNRRQVVDNARAANLPALSEEIMELIRTIYDKHI